jgi:hypothetical protein
VEKESAPVLVNLIEAMRAQNVSIALAQFKSFGGFDNVATALRNNSGLPLDKLRLLEELLPTTEEVESVRKYTGDITLLGKAEQFFLAISKVPHAKNKVLACIYAANFNDVTKSIESAMDAVRNSCESVVKSDRLAITLEAILKIGNIMNAGTHKGNQAGFKLESLPGLVATKSTDNSITLMEYLIEVLEKQGGKVLLDFPSELTGLNEGIRISMSDIRKELSLAQTNLKSLQKEVEFSSSDPSANGFVSSLTSFAMEADIYLTSLEMELSRTTKGVEELASHFGEDKSVTHSVILKYIAGNTFVKPRLYVIHHCSTHPYIFLSHSISIHQIQTSPILL